MEVCQTTKITERYKGVHFIPYRELNIIKFTLDAFVGEGEWDLDRVFHLRIEIPFIY